MYLFSEYAYPFEKENDICWFNKASNPKYNAHSKLFITELNKINV